MSLSNAKNTAWQLISRGDDANLKQLAQAVYDIAKELERIEKIANDAQADANWAKRK